MIHTDSDEGPVPVEVLQFEAAKAREADLAAATARAEKAESAAAIWEQRCSQATALSGQHLGELAAARRERDHLRDLLREFFAAEDGGYDVLASAVLDDLRAALEKTNG